MQIVCRVASTAIWYVFARWDAAFCRHLAGDTRQQHRAGTNPSCRKSDTRRKRHSDSAENLAFSVDCSVARDLPTLLNNGRKAKGRAMMINLTDSAVNAVRNAISTSDKPVDGLRIMVEAGGCAGLKYNMGLVSGIEPEDTVIEREGVRVLVDHMSLEHLEGTTIDFVVALEGSGFTFENPNAKSSCGCGKSFA
jgi:iron-sulfur cluster assembly protein